MGKYDLGVTSVLPKTDVEIPGVIDTASLQLGMLQMPSTFVWWVWSDVLHQWMPVGQKPGVENES